MKKFLLLTTLLCTTGTLIFPQTIAEKMASGAPKAPGDSGSFDGMLAHLHGFGLQFSAQRYSANSADR